MTCTFAVWKQIYLLVMKRILDGIGERNQQSKSTSCFLFGRTVTRRGTKWKYPKQNPYLIASLPVSHISKWGPPPSGCKFGWQHRWKPLHPSSYRGCLCVLMEELPFYPGWVSSAIISWLQGASTCEAQSPPWPPPPPIAFRTKNSTDKALLSIRHKL